MKCIVCDRCKKIIEDPKKYRIILCSRPLKPQFSGAKTCRSDDKQANDILWEKEVCMSCADEIENFTDVKNDSPRTRITMSILTQLILITSSQIRRILVRIMKAKTMRMVKMTRTKFLGQGTVIFIKRGFYTGLREV